MSDENPAPEPAKSWKRVMPQTRFAPGRLYTVLVPGYDAFLAIWDPELPGLVDFPQRNGEWLNPEGREDGNFTALYYHPLPPIPGDAKAECDQVWRAYWERLQRRRERG